MQEISDRSVDSISHSPFNSHPLSLEEYCNLSDDKLKLPRSPLSFPCAPFFSSPFTEFLIHSLTITS